MNPLEHFHTIADAPLHQWRHHFPDHRPVGIYNAYVPEELFQAAGLTPVYVFHRSISRGYAQKHLPSFACWPSRSLVDQLLSGELNDFAGIALAQTCDTVQALVDICRSMIDELASSQSVFHIGVPTHLKTHLARPYLVAELQRLREILGDPSDKALWQVFALYNQTRKLIDQLYRRSADLRPTDLRAALCASFLMPKQDYNRLLAQLLSEPPPTERQQEMRLMIVGPHLADPMLYQVIEAAGGCVVGDLLDVGHRYYAHPVVNNGDPIARLADRILATFPTPTKYHPGRRRDDLLVTKVVETRSHGVIFARQKFCDPHGFDYAKNRTALEKHGIPHLLVELEQSPNVGQMRTRVQAFLETIRR